MEQQYNNFAQKRFEMVESQIVSRDVADPRVLAAMRAVERHLFVPETIRSFAYADRALAIGMEQTISQPYIVAYMTEAAALTANDKVLEVGTGSGYQAAVLSEIATQVFSLERIASLAEDARQRLAELGYGNIFVRHADGYLGWKEEAPFDAIIVTAAAPAIPPELIKQLKPGGRMVIPVGVGEQNLYLVTKTTTGVIEDRLCAVRFVPMVPGK